MSLNTEPDTRLFIYLFIREIDFRTRTRTAARGVDPPPMYFMIQKLDERTYYTRQTRTLVKLFFIYSLCKNNYQRPLK